MGNRKMRHGNHCDCVLLAGVVGAEPDAIAFYYCLKVLRKHWRLTCRHGEIVDAAKEKKTSEQPLNFGEMDAVKAILIKNG